jgi:hypothetical protein
MGHLLIIMTSIRVLTVTMALAGLIIGSVVVGSSNSYGKGYQKSLAVSQANYCGQGEVGTSVQCTNTVSQTQGNDNGIALTD